MRVHFGTCDRENRCYTCPCCLELSAEQSREAYERKIADEIESDERGNLYSDFSDSEENPSEISASSVDLDDLEPEPVKKPFKKVEPVRRSVDTHVVIHRKYKNDLIVPVEEKHKLCTCPVDEEGACYCKECEVSHVIIRRNIRKYKDDLIVPVEEKYKLCTCPVVGGNVCYCRGCEASKKPVLKKYLLKK